VPDHGFDFFGHDLDVLIFWFLNRLLKLLVVIGGSAYDIEDIDHDFVVHFLFF
jgi:hypothetical protein